MGIFDKVKSLFQSKEDKKEKISKIEIDKTAQKSELAPVSDPVPAPDLVQAPAPGSEPVPAPDSVQAPAPGSEPVPAPDSEQAPALDSEQAPAPDSEPVATPDSEPAATSEPEPALYPTSNQEKLDEGLKKTKESFFGKLARTVAGKSTIDELLLDDIEEVLITSDIGVDTTLRIIEKLQERVKRDKYINTSELNSFLKEEMSSLMQDSYDDIPDIAGPYVIMIVGVNGVGKTTTIGKLAHHFKQKGKKVVLGAADTFRAAAVDQLVIWANRVGVEIIKQDMGSDPASVAFDTIQSAKASGADVVIIDTAGRLHNNVNLMRELGKIRSVMAKVISKAPHEVMLVLDASTGQNAIEQAKQFIAATDVDSITLTKLDGTAKGGVVIGVSDQFQVPVRYIGVGEGENDLQKFNKKAFIESLFN
jgi:fused signal recognition particle receptor